MLHNWTDEQIEKARKDFRVFLFMVWKALGLPDPTPLQYDVAYALQYSSIVRLIIQAFRGMGKSFITCAFVVWLLWNDPQLKIMIVSASKDRADANAIFIKRIMQTMDFLNHLLPTQGQRDTQNLFDVGPAIADISPSVKSVGITGQMTGSRADVLIADDVEVPNNSGTQMQRDKLNEAVKEFDSILKPNGRIIYLGTPQNEMSLYNELQTRGYSCMIWPALYPQDVKEREFYGERLGKAIAEVYDADPEKWEGKPTEPLRFNEIEIDSRRLSYGRAGFALQFLLNTNLSDQEKYPLKLQDLIVAHLDNKESSLKWAWAAGTSQRINDLPSVGLKGDFYYAPFSRSEETSNYTGAVMAIDPSGRGKDETAYAIVKFLNGYLFLMEVGGYQDGYSPMTLKNLATKAKFHGVNEIVYESNYGDGMFGQLLKPVLNEIYPCALEEVKHSKQKELRIIDTLEPVMASHKLIVNHSVITEDNQKHDRDPSSNAKSLFYQMTRISRERGALAHDDRLDAVTIAVAYWKDYMDRNDQIGIDEHWEEQLEIWMDSDVGILGSKQLTDNNNLPLKNLSLLKRI